MNNVYFVGTAGSGKSTMVGAFKKWLDDNEIDSIIINLDPGAEKLPYVPDIDIREWINLEDVMSQCGLGPNGAQIAAADLMAVNIDKISSVLDTYDVDYVLIDTPGQLELFAFRESSQVVVKALGKERSLMVYLSDPTLYRSANGFVSTMTLASLVQFRMNMPIINLLSKADVLKENEIDRIIDWYNNPDSLYGCLLDEDKDPESVIGMELFRAMEDTGVFGEMRSVSSETGVGLPEIYAAVQLQFHGGDDSGRFPGIGHPPVLGGKVHPVLQAAQAVDGGGNGGQPAESFGAAGIEMKIQTLEWSVYLERLEKRTYDACSLGWTTSFDPDPYQVWHSQGIAPPGSNHVGYSNPELDKLIEALRETFDENERRRIGRRIERIIHEDQPYTFLYTPYSLAAVSSRFGNVRVFPGGLATMLFTIGE